MIRKTLSLLCAVMLLGVMCGCKNNPKFTVDEILEYMNEKYGEEFTYIDDVDGNQPNKYSYSIYVKTELYPEKKILAECRVSDIKNEKSFSDNFDAIIYEDDVRSILTNITNKVYPNAKVRYIVEPLISSSYVKDATQSVEEFLVRNPIVSFTVLMEPEHDIEEKEEEIQKLCDYLIDAKIPCSFTVRYSDAKNAFDSFKVDEYEPFSQSFDLICSVEINTNYEVSYIKWR